MLDAFDKAPASCIMPKRVSVFNLAYICMLGTLLRFRMSITSWYFNSSADSANIEEEYMGAKELRTNMIIMGREAPLIPWGRPSDGWP
jgi:hypothetical protein